MSREQGWILELETIRDKLAEDPEVDWMNEWRLFNRIIEDAAAVDPEIKAWVPVAQETLGDDIIPADRIRQLVEGAIRRLKTSDS